jgi:hypothetical protein
MQLRPRRFTPKESAAGSHQTDGWVGPTAGMYVQNRAPVVNRTTIPRLSGRSLVTTLTTATRLGQQKVNQAECVLYTKEGAEEVKWALKSHRRVV